MANEETPISPAQETVPSFSKKQFFQKSWNTLKAKIVHPVRHSFEYKSSGAQQSGITRREFSKRLVGAAAIIVGGSLLAACKSDDETSDSEQPKPETYPKPEGLPNDVLTDEELKAAGITIYQTKDVQVYFRRSIFDIPLYRDAKDKKIKGVVFTLVDSDNLSWNSVDTLPYDARLAWQGTHLHPSEYSEDDWVSLIKYNQGMVEWYQGMEKSEINSKKNQEDFYRGMIDFGEKNIQEMIAFNEYLIKEGKEVVYSEELIKKTRESLQKDQQALEELQSDKEKKKLEERLAEYEKSRVKYNHELEIFKDRPAGIAYLAGQGPQGEFVDTRKRNPSAFTRQGSASPSKQAAEMFLKHTEWQDKIFIYLCVGKKGLKPEPKDSYPQPAWFEVGNQDTQSSDEHYDVFLKDPNRSTAGPTSQHESFHYNPDPKAPSQSEHNADHLALDNMTVAWNRFQQTGSNSGYPFVFATSEGMTITEKTHSKLII